MSGRVPPDPNRVVLLHVDRRETSTAILMWAWWFKTLVSAAWRYSAAAVVAAFFAAGAGGAAFLATGRFADLAGAFAGSVSPKLNSEANDDSGALWLTPPP